MKSLQPSKAGKTKIKLARQKIGLERQWTRDSEEWLKAASLVVDPDLNSSYFAPGVSYGTWNRFLTGKAINPQAFKAYCTVLGLNLEEITSVPSTSPTLGEAKRCDWNEAPDSVFYGRSDELITLKQWIVSDRCRLVTLTGMGGIGKTALASMLAKQIQTQFDFVIWRSLRNAPAIEELLSGLIQFLSPDRDFEANLATLLDYLRQYRCLLILDNAESVMASCAGTLRERAGCYRQGYEEYGELLKQVGETFHQSCLILTSREKPREIDRLEGSTRPVRFLLVTGLNAREGKQIFTENLVDIRSEEDWNLIINHYGGNPLALKIAASAIQEILDGDISEFIKKYLKKGKVFLDDVNDLFDSQFNRLSTSEQEIMYWLVINREPVSPSELQQDLVVSESLQLVIEKLMSLRRRSLIEKSAKSFSQQPMFMEYVVNRFVDRICQEIRQENLELFNNHFLMKAQAKDYVKAAQINVIIKPVIERLIATFRNKNSLENYLYEIILRLQAQALQAGYSAGNILNLLCQLKSDLRGANFSNLIIWQADLQKVNLSHTNFAHSDVSKSVFTHVFSSIVTVAASSKGILAAGDTNGEIHLWRLADNKHLLTFKGHTNWVRVVKFSPDGSKLASGSSDRTLKLWNVKTGRCLKTLSKHTSRIWDLAFSQDSKTLASCSNDQTIRLWKTDTGDLLKTIEISTGVRTVAFHPDTPQILVSGQEDGTLKLWNHQTAQELQNIQAHAEPVWSITIDPASQTLVSGSSDRTLRLWNLDTSKCFQVLSGHRGAIQQVAFSPDGQTLVSASDDKTLRLWCTNTHQQLKTLTGHTGKVQSVAFSSDSKTLCSGSNDQTIRLWDVQKGHSFKTLQGYTNWGLSLAFSPDGQILASGSNDQCIRLWDVQTGECLKTLTGHGSQIQSLEFSVQGILASGSENGGVKLWDWVGDRCLHTLPDHTNTVWMLAFSPNGQTLVSGSSDCTVRVWEVRSGECLNILRSSTGQVWSVAFSPDGRTLASSSDDGTIQFWDSSTGECLKILKPHSTQVWRIAFSPDGQTLVSCSDDQTVKLLDVKTGKTLKTMSGFTDEVLAVAFNGQILVSDTSLSSPDVKIWSVSAGKCLRTLCGHADGVWSALFSPNGQILASTSRDETTRLWDVQTGKCLKMLRVEKLYEQMNITSITGLTAAQKATLRALGAVEN